MFSIFAYHDESSFRTVTNYYLSPATPTENARESFPEAKAFSPSENVPRSIFYQQFFCIHLHGTFEPEYARKRYYTVSELKYSFVKLFRNGYDLPSTHVRDLTLLVCFRFVLTRQTKTRISLRHARIHIGIAFKCVRGELQCIVRYTDIRPLTSKTSATFSCRPQLHTTPIYNCFRVVTILSQSAANYSLRTHGSEAMETALSSRFICPSRPPLILFLLLRHSVRTSHSLEVCNANGIFLFMHQIKLFCSSSAVHEQQCLFCAATTLHSRFTRRIANRVCWRWPDMERQLRLPFKPYCRLPVLLLIAYAMRIHICLYIIVYVLYIDLCIVHRTLDII